MNSRESVPSDPLDAAAAIQDIIESKATDTSKVKTSRRRITKESATATESP